MRLGPSISGFTLACAAALGAAPSSAEDAPPKPFKVGVSYRAPASCPTMSEFMTLLARHLDGGDEAPLYAVIELSELQLGYHLDLTVYVAALPHHRAESAASCDELAHLAALMTAMARIGYQPAPEESTDPPVSTTLRDETPAPEVKTPIARAPELDKDTSNAHSPSSTAGARVMIGAQVQSGIGVLPGLAFGSGAHADLGGRTFGVRVGGSFWLPRTFTAPGGPESLPPLELQMQSLDVAACLKHALYESAPLALGLRGCAVLSGYRLGASGRPFGEASDVTYRGAAGFAAGASLALSGALEIGLQFALADLARPFSVHAAPLEAPLYESETNHLRLELSIGFPLGAIGGG